MNVVNVTRLTRLVDYGSAVIEEPTGEVRVSLDGYVGEVPPRWQDGTEYALITKRRAELMSFCRGADQDGVDRLDTGDLKRIGDAVLEQREVLVRGLPLARPEKHFFDMDAAAYTVAPERITVGDVSFPKPLSEAPVYGELVYDAWSTVVSNWAGHAEDAYRLSEGRLHLTKEAAEEHRRALVKLSGGEV